MKMSKQSAYFTVPGLNGRHAVQMIKQVLSGIDGVLSVSADVKGDKVAVDYDSTGTDAHEIESRFRDIGVGAQLVQNQDHTM